MYKVTIISNNGYRCCCNITNKQEHIVNTLHEAYKYLPAGPSLDLSNIGYEIEYIEIKDITNNEVVAKGQLTWMTHPTNRSLKYQYNRWTGFYTDSMYKNIHHFDVISSHNIDNLWNDLCEYHGAINTKNIRVKEYYIDHLEDDDT